MRTNPARKGYKQHRNMKTIQLIIETVKNMKKIGLPANMQVGSIELLSKGSTINWAGRNGEYKGSFVKFNLIFRPDHIQMLINLGVKIDFEGCKMNNLSEKSLRFKKGKKAIKQGRYAPYYYMGDPSNKQTGVIENWLITTASCSIECLEKLDAICRDNYRTEINISNDHTLINVGFKIVLPDYILDTHNLTQHLQKIANIRKQARRLFAEKKIKFLPANYKNK